jgi:hypothetical protein
VPAKGKNDDFVASIVSFFTQQKNWSLPASHCKFQNSKAPVNYSCSPSKKEVNLNESLLQFGQKCLKKLKTNFSKKRQKVRSNSTDTESVVMAVAVMEAFDSNVNIPTGPDS